MKPTRSRSRKVLTIEAEPSAAAQPENVSEEQESHEARPTNGEAMARMAKFVAENPNIFKELRRYFKRQGKQKAEFSKRKPDESSEVPFEEESDGRHSNRSTPNGPHPRLFRELPPFLGQSYGVSWGNKSKTNLAIEKVGGGLHESSAFHG